MRAIFIFRHAATWDAKYRNYSKDSGNLRFQPGSDFGKKSIKNPLSFGPLAEIVGLKIPQEQIMCVPELKKIVPILCVSNKFSKMESEQQSQKSEFARVYGKYDLSW